MPALISGIRLSGVTTNIISEDGASSITSRTVDTFSILFMQWLTQAFSGVHLSAGLIVATYLFAALPLPVLCPRVHPGT